MNKNKNLNHADLAKKIEEITKEKDKLKLNEKAIKDENEIKVSELMSSFDKEKDQLKKKISEIEKNLREVEGKRGALLLELEKEKSKWAIEKDNLLNKNSEINDKISNLERKNESLLRENEKLKNEKNALRKQYKNDSKYSMYRDNNTSMLSNTSMLKGDSNRTYNNFANNYQNQMLKILGEIDIPGGTGDKLDKYYNTKLGDISQNKDADKTQERRNTYSGFKTNITDNKGSKK